MLNAPYKNELIIIIIIIVSALLFPFVTVFPATINNASFLDVL